MTPSARKITRRSVRRPVALADRLVGRMRVPHPFTRDAYQAVLSEVVGTTIRLVPFSATAPGQLTSLTGMTVPLANTTYVFYRSDASPVHQLHVIHHELFHILAGHPGIPVSDEHLKNALIEMLKVELPHLNADLIRHLVGRGCTNGHSDDRHERDAERFAVAVAQRLGLTTPALATDSADEETDKIGRLFSEGNS